MIRAALSNTPEIELSEIMAARDLDSYLDIIRGGGNWPKSESLARFLREFEFDPLECIFLGDGKGDMAAASIPRSHFLESIPGRGSSMERKVFSVRSRTLPIGDGVCSEWICKNSPPGCSIYLPKTTPSNYRYAAGPITSADTLIFRASPHEVAGAVRAVPPGPSTPESPFFGLLPGCRTLSSSTSGICC